MIFVQLVWDNMVKIYNLVVRQDKLFHLILNVKIQNELIFGKQLNKVLSKVISIKPFL